MAEQIIGASIKVDAGNSIKTVKELRQEIKGAKEVLATAAEGTAEYEEAQKRLARATDLVNASTGKGNLKQLREEVRAAKEAMDGASEGSEEYQRAQDRLSHATDMLTAATRNTSPTIKELKAEVKAAQEAMESAAAGSDEYKAAQERLSSATDALNGATGKGAGGIKEMAGQVLGSIPGFQGLQGVSMQLLKSFAMLALTPVGLVLTAIAAVIALVKAAMDRSEESTNKIKVAFSAFSGIVNVVLKALEPLGKFLIDGIVFGLELAGKAAQETMKLISGALSFLGFDDAAAGVDKFNQSITEGVKGARELAKAEIEHEEAQRKARITQLAYQKDAEKLRQTRDNENLTLAQRIKANEELGVVLRKQLNEELNLAKTALKVAELRIAQEGRTKAALDAQAAALTEIADIEERLTGQESEQLQNRVSLQKEYAEKAQAAREEAAAKAKEARDKQRAFDEQLLKIQQENQLMLIKDSYQREKQELENKLADERRTLKQSFEDGQITRAQYNQLLQETDKKADLQRAELTEKNNKEVADKEAAFQKELAALSTQIRLKGITDQREQERAQLQQGYDEKLQDAITRYAEDGAKLAQVKALLDEQFRQDQAKMEEQYRLEDEQKKLDKELLRQQEIIDAQNWDFEAKRLAVEAEQALIDEAFANKVLTEEAYTQKVKELTDARKTIAELETEHKKAQVQEVADTLQNLGGVVAKQTIAGKALGVATALINTYQGASEAIKQKSTLPSPFDVAAKVVNVAAVIATGLKTVKAITSVPVPGGGGGSSAGGAAPAVAPAAPIAPTQASTKLDAQTINDLGNAAAGGVNKAPVRAYVVDADISNSADRNGRLERAATVG